jgi:hypothetical protein
LRIDSAASVRRKPSPSCACAASQAGIAHRGRRRVRR